MNDMITDLLKESIIKEKKARKEFSDVERLCFEIGYNRCISILLDKVADMPLEVRQIMIPCLFDMSKNKPKP
jgi:hypothetical protein